AGGRRGVGHRRLIDKSIGRGRWHDAEPVNPNLGGPDMAILDDKVAIVTGSARGIGRATAELLAEQGAKVLINDLDGDVAEQAASEIQGETTVFAGDLTKEGVADELVQKAVDAVGKRDIIVNNAAYTWD